jgi:hypothetical protein
MKLTAVGPIFSIMWILTFPSKIVYGQIAKTRQYTPLNPQCTKTTPLTIERHSRWISMVWMKGTTLLSHARLLALLRCIDVRPFQYL